MTTFNDFSSVVASPCDESSAMSGCQIRDNSGLKFNKKKFTLVQSESEQDVSQLFRSRD